MSTNPLYGNQYFTNVRNLASADIQRVKADEVSIGSRLILPIVVAGSLSEGVQGQVAILNNSGTYTINVYDAGVWQAL